jgi:hypothetical protein
MNKTPPLNEEAARKWLSQKSRRSFITGGLTALAGYGGWRWLGSRRDTQGVPWPLRNILELNGDLWHDYFRADRQGPDFTPPPAGKKPRFNGDAGLEKDFDPAHWQLKVESGDPDEEALTLKMADLRWLPKVETTAEFKCIEGWSDVISYAGVRFSDFMMHYEIGLREDGTPYPYVGLETPNRKYYVSIDVDSMMHPKTLLAYEMNGQPLSMDDGSPLRLIIPVKYGIKSLKRIGQIRFSNTRPPDYWAERGYDWFAGL